MGKMTFGQLEKETTKRLLNLSEQDINDWRPAGDMYLEDIVEVSSEDNWASFPNGIRYWLNNGDSIIYVLSTDKSI